LTCEQATHNDWVKRWGYRTDHDHGEACTANYCVASVDIGNDEPPVAGCASSDDFNNCPGLSEYLYDDGDGYDCQGNPTGDPDD